MTTAHRSSARRLLATGGVLIASSLVLAGCSAGGATSPTAAAPQFTLTADTPDPVGDIDSFTWSLYAEPYSLAFPYAFDYPPNQILANICDSLLRWNADLTLSPGLATSFANPTPTTWVYEIRPDVTFHDGTVLTAEDVVASLSAHMNPEVGSYWASVFADVASIVATAPLEVTVTTNTPNSQFNQYMAAAPGVVESAATLAADGADYGNPSTGVNCTGPFSFTSWEPGQSITLTRYDDYWDKDLVAKAGEVKFVFLQDPNTRINAFTSGDVDGGWSVPSNAIKQLQDSDAGNVFFGVNNATTSEIVSNLDGPLGNVDVRKALLMATDRKGIISAAESGYATEANALVPKIAWGGIPTSTVDAAYADLESYPYDVAAAKKLVADAGVAGEEIVIATSPVTAGAEVLSQAMAAAATAIGLKPTIQTISADQYSALFSDPSAREGIDLFMTNWYLSTSDPIEMYGVLQTGQFSNYGAWSDSDYDAAVTSAIGELDATTRAGYSSTAQQIANDQLPWLPLYTTPTTVFLSKKITGVAPSINFMYYPWAATIGAAG